MTEEEAVELVVEWVRAKGGAVTDEDFDVMSATLGMAGLDPDVATLAQAREALGLGPKVAG